MAVPKLYLVLMVIRVDLYLGFQTVHEEARTREKPASSTAKVAEMDEGGGCPHPQKTQPRSPGEKILFSNLAKKGTDSPNAWICHENAWQK